MPGFDGTGPLGQGPFTGGGRGYCAVNLDNYNTGPAAYPDRRVSAPAPAAPGRYTGGYIGRWGMYAYPMAAGPGVYTPGRAGRFGMYSRIGFFRGGRGRRAAFGGAWGRGPRFGRYPGRVPAAGLYR